METEFNDLPTIVPGSFVEFDERPHGVPSNAIGVVLSAKDGVITVVVGSEVLTFEDASSWDSTGRFKRETPFVLIARAF
jgi:hypothetical protein